jgi:ankyrin repeat protein
MTAAATQSATGELIAAIGTKDINLALVRRLLEQGGDPNEGFSNGCAFLHVAAGGSPELVELLLEHGADLEIRTTEAQYTPLMLAVMYNNISALTLLIKKGALLDPQDCAGHTALDWANAKSHVEAAEVITHAIEQKAAEKMAAAFHDTAANRQERLKNLRPKMTARPA